MLEDVKKQQAEEREKAQKENVKRRKLKRGKCEGGLSGDEGLRGQNEREVNWAATYLD